MRTSQIYLVTALVALGVLACKKEGYQEEAPADTTAVAAPAATETPTPAQVTYTLVVTNPMPHAMSVTATLPDGSQVQLGTVQPSGEGSFSVTGAAGQTVTVTATDEGNTHSPTGTVSLPAGETTVRWTIQ